MVYGLRDKDNARMLSVHLAGQKLNPMPGMIQSICWYSVTPDVMLGRAVTCAGSSAAEMIARIEADAGKEPLPRVNA